MATPTIKEFTASARRALAEVVETEDLEKVCEIFDRKGVGFDFYSDGEIDSLDMLDLVFHIDHDLKIKVGLGELQKTNAPMNIRNLYNSIRKVTETPA